MKNLEAEQIYPTETLPGDKLPSYLKMYEISGQEAIAEHSFDRYKRDKEQDAVIKEVIESHDFFREKIKNTPEGEITSLIKSGLEDPNIGIRRAAAEMIRYGWVPEEEMASLAKLLLKNPKVEVREELWSLTTHVPREERASLIKLGLENPNVEVQTIFAQKIDDLVPKQERTSLIKLGLENPNIEVQKAAARMIDRAPEGEEALLRNMVLEKIKQGLEIPDSEVQKTAAEMVRFVSEKEKSPLIKFGLENPSINIQKIFVEEIHLIPEKERASLIKLGLENPNVEVQKAAARMINCVPGEEAAPLIKLGLENPNIEVQKAAAGTIWIVKGEGTSLEAMVLGKMKQSLNNERISLEAIVLEKMKQGLDNPDIEVQKIAARMIDCAPKEEREKLFNLIRKKGLAEELIKPPLYKDGVIDEKLFSRNKFEKTGSGTTLVGGELKGKTIIRHIEPEAFLSWQRLYEDYNAWQGAGFDYVPVEPIQSYRFNEKNGLVDVFSGVLDLNLESWLNKVGLFKNELLHQEEEIMDVLGELKIRHGHTHRRNFCLRFFRDENGRVDFNRVPRLYLIDFDMAVSPKV